MNVIDFEKNIQRAHQLVYSRQRLIDFIESAPQSKVFWVGVPAVNRRGSSSAFNEPTVYIETACPGFATDAAKEQVADLERQLIALGVTDWVEQEVRET